MAAPNEVTLTNHTSNKAIFFRCVAPVKVKRAQPAMPIPLIGTSPTNTFLFRFQGQSETISFTFAIFDDDVDVANGTHTATIKTVQEQIDYLKTHIYTSAYSDYWEIYQARYYPDTTNCVITDLEFDNQAGGVNIVTGSITLMIGRIGAV